MVSSRKRGWQEMATPDTSEPPQELGLLDRLRNMWEFANLAQWIFIFGKVVKIDESIDIEELETECLKPQSPVLPAIGLCLLKFLSSHRGLTPELFDEYTRRQYRAKAPGRPNPFGDEEVAARFTDFDVFKKIRILQQMTQWTFWNPDRMREKMDERTDSEQTFWRIEPFGWDAEDRSYFVLDDNRLYRRTDPLPPPSPAPKSKRPAKKQRTGTRSSKRTRSSIIIESDSEEVEEEASVATPRADPEDDTLGGMKWECVAITLDQLNDFLSTIKKSRDPNEKILRSRLTEDLLPILEKQNESAKRKALQKEKELLNLQKMANAKRSSRIAGRIEQQRHEEEERENQKKRQTELSLANKEQERWAKLEAERESRIAKREKRLKEREARRIQHEQELAELSENSKKLNDGEGRISERSLKQRLERKQQQLQELNEEEEDWIFDCICGAYGQVDDGSHSIACEKCNIWQHSKCVKIKASDAEREDFHFVCSTCKKRAEESQKAEKAKEEEAAKAQREAEQEKTQSSFKIKFNRPGSSSSHASPSSTSNVKVENRTPAKSTNGHGPIDSSPIKMKTPGGGPLVIGASPVKAAAPLLPPYSTPAASASVNLYPLSSTSQVTPAADRGIGAKVNSSGSFSTPNAFSPPAAHSPISLPPPTQPRVYATYSVDGNKPQSNVVGSEGRGLSSLSADTDSTSQVASTNPQTRMPMQSAFETGSAQSQSSPQKQQPQHSSSGSDMLSSSKILGRTMGTPIAPSGSDHDTPSALQQNQVTNKSERLQETDEDHASALPPSSTGVSPVKHSPPRTSSAVQNLLGSATPSVLPPVTSLTPSPPIQNLTPPVKISDPVVARPNGQNPARHD